MDELGVDPRTHASKSVEPVDPATVHTVVTLCAEEVRPVVLEGARRLHRPIPDPASPNLERPRTEMLGRFRAARDAIRQKLEAARVELLAP
jgi:arsenate reductase